jgi:undecaprenyl-diphosphatase
MLYLSTIIMGLVEGITEFLPVSSTGHLVLTGHYLGFDQLIGGEDAAKAFEIIIQLGAILAVVAAYPGRFVRLLHWNDNRGFSGLRGLGLLAVTSIPAAILGYLTHKTIHEGLMRPIPVAIALAVGAVGILVVEWLRPRTKTEGIDALTWREALWVGLFQCLSLWPGMSRSASTIVGGMLSGVERKTATEYSFFAAVPIMIVATLFEFYKNFHLFVEDASRAGIFALGFVVAFFSAWAAVKVFLHFVGRHTLVPFGWYRLALAGLVLWHAYHSLPGS